MKYKYLVNWDNGSQLHFTAGKMLSHAEIQFLIWHHFRNAPLMPMPDSLANAAMRNYSMVLHDVPREYWEQYSK